jgi:hypothetical protein
VLSFIIIALLYSYLTSITLFCAEDTAVVDPTTIEANRNRVINKIGTGIGAAIGGASVGFAYGGPVGAFVGAAAVAATGVTTHVAVEAAVDNYYDAQISGNTASTSRPSSPVNPFDSTTESSLSNPTKGKEVSFDIHFDFFNDTFHSIIETINSLISFVDFNSFSFLALIATVFSIIYTMLTINPSTSMLGLSGLVTANSPSVVIPLSSGTVSTSGPFLKILNPIIIKLNYNLMLPLFMFVNL